MKVTVTQKHIDCGVGASHGYCAIALAVKDCCPDAVVEVGRNYANVGRDRYWLPLTAVAFIGQFDHLHLRAQCKPFDFDLLNAEPVVSPYAADETESPTKGA